MNSILRIAIPSPLRQSFDYLPPDNYDPASLLPGVRVKVPWRNKSLIGILLETSKESAVALNKLKRAETILDKTPLLTNSILRLATWAADYYHHPIGEVITGCIPTYLRQGKSFADSIVIARSISDEAIQSDSPGLLPASLIARGRNDFFPTNENIKLNIHQQKALQEIIQAKTFQTFLLDGVTGSGKTEVYLQAIAEILSAGKQALILVPEIGLTPQTIARFQQRFSTVTVALHSGLNEKERAQAWWQAKTNEAKIIIGTRSAIFTPLLQPGIIIVDEEHDISFKQQSGFRYSARDLAIVRGQLENVPVILGSATPSLESLYNVSRQRFHYLQLPLRAGTAIPPKFHLIDVRNQQLDEGLSKPLLAAMQKHLEQKGQVLLFLNRRGFAPTLLCHSCGWIAQCQRCDARMTMHQKPKQLFCHHCNATQSIIISCPKCHSANLLALGLGTERLEQTLTRHFPHIEILRIDRDTTRKKDALQKMFAKIYDGQQQILIGTQMLTKGHHFPNVTMVSIVDTDSSLFSADFRASEKMGQLIIQVAGRAGRAEKLGEVYLQTHFPEHPLLTKLITANYTDFTKLLLQERQVTQLPPYAHLALLRAESVTAAAPLEFLKQTAETIQTISSSVQIWGPIPAVLARKAGKHRAQLFINAKHRKELQTIIKKLTQHLENLKSIKKVRWSLDIDPQEMG